LKNQLEDAFSEQGFLSHWVKSGRRGKKCHHFICIPSWLTSQLVSHSFKSSLHGAKRGDQLGANWARNTRTWCRLSYGEHT